MKTRGLMSCAVAVALTGCAHQEPRIVTQQVRVPVAVACAPKTSTAPAYAADNVPLDGTIFDLVQALLMDREQRRGRELELQAALAACR